MEYSKKPFDPVFVRLGAFYLRPEHIIGLAPYKNSATMTLVLLSNGVDIPVSVPLEESVKILQGAS